MMLRLSNSKSSMLFKILSVGETPRVEVDELLDKTTIQGLSASRGLCAVLHRLCLGCDFFERIGEKRIDIRRFFGLFVSDCEG